jgi:hypothetical protein
MASLSFLHTSKAEKIFFPHHKADLVAAFYIAQFEDPQGCAFRDHKGVRTSCDQQPAMINLQPSKGHPVLLFMARNKDNTGLYHFLQDNLV